MRRGAMHAGMLLGLAAMFGAGYGGRGHYPLPPDPRTPEDEGKRAERVARVKEAAAARRAARRTRAKRWAEANAG